VTDIAARMCACADQIQAEHAPEYLLRAGAATIAELRAEVERLQAIAWRAEDRANTATDVSKLAADLLEIAEIKDEIVEACARWQLRSLDVDTRPLRITTEHLIDSKAFGNKCFDATLADWRAARDWLRSVTVNKAPEPEPPDERLSEPIDTMTVERCDEVSDEAGITMGIIRDRDRVHTSWTATWLDSHGDMRFYRRWANECNAMRYALKEAARGNGLLRMDSQKHKCVLLPPLSEEATD
jgi:hypothetical protein